VRADHAAALAARFAARSATAARVVRWLGVVLLVVAVIHLAVTPLIAGFLASQMAPGAWQVVRPPALLNHVVVSILLVPVGATLLGLGPQLRSGSASAWRIAIVHALRSRACRSWSSRPCRARCSPHPRSSSRPRSSPSPRSRCPRRSCGPAHAPDGDRGQGTAASSAVRMNANTAASFAGLPGQLSSTTTREDR
jgi:hypothetical protein